MRSTAIADGGKPSIYLCGPIENTDAPRSWRDDLKERYPEVGFIDPMSFQEDWDDDPEGVIRRELDVCERYPILANNLGADAPRTVDSHHEIAHALANGNDLIAAVCRGEPARFIKHRVPVFEDVDEALSYLLTEAEARKSLTDGEADDA